MKDGGPVYPIRTDARHVGISARDYFAAAALTGELASQSPEFSWTDMKSGDLAKRCYLIADAMLAERERDK